MTSSHPSPSEWKSSRSPGMGTSCHSRTPASRWPGSGRRKVTLLSSTRGLVSATSGMGSAGTLPPGAGHGHTNEYADHSHIVPAARTADNITPAAGAASCRRGSSGEPRTGPHRVVAGAELFYDLAGPVVSHRRDAADNAMPPGHSQHQRVRTGTRKACVRPPGGAYH